MTNKNATKEMIVYYGADGKSRGCEKDLTEKESTLVRRVLNSLGCNYDLYTLSL